MSNVCVGGGQRITSQRPESDTRLMCPRGVRYTESSVLVQSVLMDCTSHFTLHYFKNAVSLCQLVCGRFLSLLILLSHAEKIIFLSCQNITFLWFWFWFWSSAHERYSTWTTYSCWDLLQTHIWAILVKECLQLCVMALFTYCVHMWYICVEQLISTLVLLDLISIS